MRIDGHDPTPGAMFAALDRSSPSLPSAIHVRLPRGSEAPGLARRRLANRFANLLAPAALHGACLVVSELVTNAVVHGSGLIALGARLDGDTLRVEVVDEGTGNSAAIREQAEDDGGGWGLRIVDTLSVRWGAHEGSTHVWAELAVA